MKAYEIKAYDPFGTFKRQITPRNVTNAVSYSEQLDGGQGDMTLSVIGNPDDYQCGDIIEIRELVL